MFRQSIFPLLVVISLVFSGCSNISGAITAEDGSEVEGVVLKLAPKEGGVIEKCTADSEGRCILSGIKDGIYIVTANKDGYTFDPDSKEVTVKGEDIDIVFKASGYFREVLPQNIEAGDWLGAAVSISGEYAIAGAHGDDDKGSDSGAVYVYKREENAWVELPKLTAEDGEADARFGKSVFIAGDVAVVGAPGHDGAGPDSGAAYIFYRNEGGPDHWGQKARLVADDAATSDGFGSSVSISEDVVIVGACGDDEARGSAYIFHRDQGGANNWGKVEKLTADTPEVGDEFGFSVAISGDYALVGARGDDGNGLESGSVYFFYRNLGGTDNWGRQQKRLETDGAAGDLFGSAVAISGDYAVVGAFGDEGGTGSAHLFYRNQGGVDNWGQKPGLSPEDGEAYFNFGKSVAISGGYAIVGAMGDEGRTGSAYIFFQNEGEVDTWGKKDKLVAWDDEAGDNFGVVAICPGSLYAMVGAPNANAAGTDSGSAFIYSKNWVERAKTTASDGAVDDRFGWSTSVSGDYAVVGAPNIQGNGFTPGSAYILYRNQGGPENWGEQAILTPSDGVINDGFGYSSSISGDYAVVGSVWHDNAPGSGSAYLFYRNQGGADNWGQYTELTASDGATQDGFGGKASISGDYVIVGAYADDEKGEESGSVYIYYRNQGGADSWGEQAHLTASDGAAYDWFASNSISGDYAVVGAPGRDDNGDESGAAYILYRNQGGADNWGEQAKLLASDGAAGDHFGFRVSISGDSVIVGAVDDDDDNGDRSGSAYIFYRDQGGANNWGQQAKLTASDGAIEDVFGCSVSISGDYVVIGAAWDDDNGDGSGSAYVFKRGSIDWIEQYKLTASDGAFGDGFGASASISGDIVIIGATGDDDNGNLSGSAYIFDK